MIPEKLKQAIEREKNIAELIAHYELKEKVATGKKRFFKQMEQIINRNITDKVIQFPAEKHYIIRELTNSKKLTENDLTTAFIQKLKTLTENGKTYRWISHATLQRHWCETTGVILRRKNWNVLLLFLGIEPKKWSAIIAKPERIDKHLTANEKKYLIAIRKGVENRYFTCIVNTEKHAPCIKNPQNETLRTDVELAKNHQTIKFLDRNSLLVLPENPEQIGSGLYVDYAETKARTYPAMFCQLVTDNLYDDTRNMLNLLLNTHTLLHRNITIETFATREKYPVFNSAQKIKKFVGSYCCYMVGYDNNSIRGQKIIINDDASALFQSVAVTYKGIAGIELSGNILRFDFDYMPDSHKYRYSLLFDLGFQSPAKLNVKGVISGLDAHNQPFAKRVFLVNSPTDNPPFQYSDEKSIQSIARKYPELIAYFTGLDNHYSESLHMLMRLDSISS